MSPRLAGEWHRAAGGSPGEGVRSPMRWSRTVVATALIGCVTAAALALAFRWKTERYPQDHRQVTAEIVRTVGAPVAGGRALPAPGITVEVAWTGADGRRHTGRTFLGLSQDRRDPVRVWVDGEDKLSPGPPATEVIVLGSLLGGAGAVGFSWTAFHAVRAGRRAWTARRAMAGWEREWRDFTAAR